MNSQYRKNLKAILEAVKQYIDEKISGGEQEMILEVASITGLTNSQCQDLSCGDVVVENNNGAKTTYIVFSKTATTMSLTYVDSTKSKEVKYEVSNNAWAYDETVTTALGGGGSTTHTLIDIQSRLEGTKLNWTKFVSFLSDLGFDTTLLVEDYMLTDMQSFLSIGNATIMNIYGVTSSTDIDYYITTLSATSNSGSGQPKTIANMFASTTFETIENYGASMEIAEYFYLVAPVILCTQYDSTIEDIITIGKIFDWEDFFDCFDLVE